jgi:hypothetical protein
MCQGQRSKKIARFKAKSQKNIVWFRAKGQKNIAWFSVEESDSIGTFLKCSRLVFLDKGRLFHEKNVSL